MSSLSSGYPGENLFGYPVDSIPTEAYQQAALPFLVDESFVNSWLAEGYGVSQLLPLTLVETAWNRWPLVYDPEGFAALWIKQSRGEELRHSIAFC